MAFSDLVQPLKANNTQQTQSSTVGSQFGLDKASQQKLKVTGGVGASFGLDRAASQPMTITGNVQNAGPRAMDLNNRSDRRLMRRYIRTQRNNGDVARNVNAWEAVRNMRNDQNTNGVTWDSTGHQIQKQNNVIQQSTPSTLLSRNSPQAQDVTQKMNSVLNIGNYQVSGVPQNYASTPIQMQNNKPNRNIAPKQNVVPPVNYTQPANIELNLDTSVDSWRDYNRSRGINIGVNNSPANSPANTPVNESVINNTPGQSVTAVPGRTFTKERTMDGHWVVQGTDGQKYAMYGFYDYRPMDANTQLTTAPNSTESNSPSLWNRAKSFVGGLFSSDGVNYQSTSETIDGKTVYVDPSGNKYISNGNFGGYTKISRNGGVLKAQQGAQLQDPTPFLTRIMRDKASAMKFAQALGMSLDELVTASADPEASQELERIAQKVMTQQAKHGAKLEYISFLRGKCPEGQELVYFAKGGKLCSACMGKKMEDGGEAGYMKSFRDRQKKKQMEKCGGKMKKGK